MNKTKIPQMSRSIRNVDAMMKKVKQLLKADCDEELFRKQLLECKTLQKAKAYYLFGMMAYVLHYGLRLEEGGSEQGRIHPFTTYNWLLAQFPAEEAEEGVTCVPVDPMPAPHLLADPEPSGMTREEAINRVQGYTLDRGRAEILVHNAVWAAGNKELAFTVAFCAYMRGWMDKEVILSTPFCQLMADIARFPTNRNVSGVNEAFRNCIKNHLPPEKAGE